MYILVKLYYKLYWLKISIWCIIVNTQLIILKVSIFSIIVKYNRLLNIGILEIPIIIKIPVYCISLTPGLF